MKRRKKSFRIEFDSEAFLVSWKVQAVQLL